MKIPDWKEALASVPGIACVAFAARCARRVQPLFLVSWPAAPQRLYALLDGAIETVEESVQGVDRTNSTFAFNAMSAVKGASKANAEQASLAASTVACATYSLTAVGYGTFSATHAAQAADYSVEAFRVDDSAEQRTGLCKVVAAMQHDIDRLHAGIRNGSIAEDQPLPPGFLGPLWPDGEPEYVTQLPVVDETV